MESFEEAGHISNENFLEVPTLSDSLSEDEDVKATLQPRFSPSPRRRNSDSSEEMELDAPSTVARKVSFADAFGFDLVSVKEFDTWDVPKTLPNDDLDEEVVPVEEFYLTPLFTLPATEEELLQKVREQKVWLESVEFLPGITCMKGIIRVLNVSFDKLIYVRMSLDNWLTYYDILGEYVPNSCDGETDQFLFKISLVPPYQRDGVKVEFCLRYETSVGIFWANNDKQNYILICHKKEAATSLDPEQNEEEITDKQLKGCLKTTPNSKEEKLAADDEDIWNDFRTSESEVPQILYSYVGDDEIEQKKEKPKTEIVEHPEDDNEDEKELELLLGQHFTRSAGSSRDERPLDTTEPLIFQNEPKERGDKVDSGFIRQPLPISSSLKHALHNKEVYCKEMYSKGHDYSQSSPEKFTAIDLTNNTLRPSECFVTSETLLSPEYQFGTKQNEAVRIEDMFSSKHGTCHADVQKDEFDSPPGSKTTEEIFISEDDYDHHKNGVWEERSKGVPLEHSEGTQLREDILEGWNGNAKPFQEQHMTEIYSQIPGSSLETTAQYGPQGEKFENKNKECLSGELNTNNLTDENVTTCCLSSSQAKDEIVEGEYKTEFNIDKGKEIKLSILEPATEEKQVHSNLGHRKHNTQSNNGTIGTGELLPEGVKTSVPSKAKYEKIDEYIELSDQDDRGSAAKSNKAQESTNSVTSELSQDLRRTESNYLVDTQNTHRFCISCPDFGKAADEQISPCSASIKLEDVDDTRGNLGEVKYSQKNDPANILGAEPCQSKPDRDTTGDKSGQERRGNQSWSDLESQQAEGESEGNGRTQMKEGTGGEVMWGIRDNTQYLNVTPTDELFTCQDPERYEETSVAKHDSIGEAETVAAAYIIKMTSESTPEKMSAGEKAVIVKLPQETALSDRPTEERETVFDIHEGKNDGSHYPLCQCNTEGVLYDTKFKREQVSDICNARIHEMVQGKMISVCSTSETVTGAEHNIRKDATSDETLWTSSAAGKATSDQDLHLETSLKSSQDSPQSLQIEEAEDENMCVHPEIENKVLPPDINIVGSSYESPSVTSSEKLVETHSSKREGKLHLHTDASVEMTAESGCDSKQTNETVHTIISDPSLGGQLLSSGESSTGQFAHQVQFKQGWPLRPTILIREASEEREETRSESKDLRTEIKENIEGRENPALSDPEQPPGRQIETCSLSSECLVLKHIGYKILYFLLFVVFCVTLYHYDLIVCFALYLFSLYWLYCEGRRNKDSVRK